MGKFAKWIGGGLGWAFFGPIGGILGFFIGTFLDETRQFETRTAGPTTTGDFAMSLLVLVAAVMKADGRVVKSELDYVKSYFIRTFGQG
ncbi:MAG: TerB family tellurite resistance protein, partial [Bacteroidales bacterium]|nr:TerB family tellurite resistance protein [Bacteroidales bacterium]